MGWGILVRFQSESVAASFLPAMLKAARPPRTSTTAVGISQSSIPVKGSLSGLEGGMGAVVVGADAGAVVLVESVPGIVLVVDDGVVVGVVLVVGMLVVVVEVEGDVVVVDVVSSSSD